MAKLNVKQKRFVDEYLIDLNATQAAIRAGYSKKRASEIGYQLLQKTTVQESIQKSMDDRANRTQITADRVLQEYAKIGFADIKDFLSFRTAQTVVDRDKEGKPVIDYASIIELKDSEQVDGAVISEVSLKDGSLKFKLHDKKGALDSIARHLGMFNDKLEVKGHMTFEQLLDVLDE